MKKTGPAIDWVRFILLIKKACRPYPSEWTMPASFFSGLMF
ncbi:hypothetical protein HS9_04221 [Bacillus velezensis]|nr:hypothetical protein HS9_04221 [Bacillus velezensis]